MKKNIKKSNFVNIAFIYIVPTCLISNTFVAPGYTEVNQKIQQTNKLDQVLPKNQLSQELAELDRLIKQNPKDAIAYNNRAIFKFKNLRDKRGALSDYDKSIELNPNNAIVYTNRAILKQYVEPEIEVDFLSDKDLLLILADYDKAMQLNPKDAISYELRATLKHSDRGVLKIVQHPTREGELLVSSGWVQDLSGALTDYNKAIELNSDDASTYNNRGYLKQFDLKDLTGAMTDYNKAIELDPNNVVAHKYRDLLKENKKNDRESIMDHAKSARMFFFENNSEDKIYGRRINYSN
jgi:Flp pilus assembly protein TadD